MPVDNPTIEELECELANTERQLQAEIVRKTRWQLTNKTLWHVLLLKRKLSLIAQIARMRKG